MVASVLDGFNATIMAYGQTGAGKTFTMSGVCLDFPQRKMKGMGTCSILGSLCGAQAGSTASRVSCHAQLRR